MESIFENYQLLVTSGLFDSEYYLATNPDVAKLQIDPLVHYLEFGGQELRDPHALFDSRRYIGLCKALGEQPENPLVHFIKIGAQRALSPWRKPGAGLERRSFDADPPATDLARFALHLEELRVAVAPAGGVQLSGQGWLVALAPIAEITISFEGRTTRALYGLHRSDVAEKFPKHPKSDHAGFVFSFAVDPDSLRGKARVAPTFTVIATTGESFTQAIESEIDQAEALIDLVPVDAVTSAVASLPQDEPPLLINIDTVAIDDTGILHIVGWAICFVPISVVQIFLDGERLGAADYGKLRDDVALAHPKYPNARLSGFQIDAAITQFGAGEKTVKVQALASSGISREILFPVQIRSTQEAVPSARPVEPTSHYDVVELFADGRLAVRGWTIGPAATEAIRVLLDGSELGSAEIGIERPDVGNHFPAIPHARHAGFGFRTQTAAIAEGEHLIVLLVRSEGKETVMKLPVLALPAANEPVHQAVGDDRMMLSIDIPKLVSGQAVAPLRGNSQVVGWALAKAGVASIDISIDGSPLMSAYYGIRRPDVLAAFPSWDDAIVSGFSALLPHRTLPRGRHTITVTLRDKTGGALQNEFRVEIEETPETIGPWSLRRKIAPAEVKLGLGILDRQALRPVFSLILSMAGDEDEIVRARRTLASLEAQVYAEWRLFVAPRGNATALPNLDRELLEGFEHLVDKIERIAEPSTYSVAQLIRDADRSSFIAVARPGDEFGCDELLEFAVHAAMNKEADFLYADERRLDPVSGAPAAYFKPSWSPDLLLSTNYIGATWCARGDLVRGVGSTISDFCGRGVYDQVLRLTERAQAIHHVPTVLSQRFDRNLDSEDERRSALQGALARRGIAGEVQSGCAPGIYRVKRKLAASGLVSIIIPTCAARGLIKTCIETLRKKTAYRNFEIVCIENIPKHERKWKRWLKRHADKVISTSEAFNWSRFNNLAAAAASGEFLLFLNDDIEIIDPEWLDALLEHAQRPEVGVVGARLLYPDRRVQHAGMFLAANGVARHAFRYMTEDDAGYFGLALTQRNVIAVTGACLLTRRETFAALGEFDERHSVVNNDLDYCLRSWQRGFLNILTPHARLIHHELASRAAQKDEYNEAAFESQWRGVFVAGDPFYHPRLSRERDDFAYEWEPIETRCAGHPLLDREKLKKILIVKLDHIGDCIVAIPAVRRLRHHFPNARLFVLAGRATQAIWSLEQAVDEVIEFDFFHARSGLGRVERTEEDWRALERRLAGYRFDLAVDLRKHTETRPVLQHVGARYLAGFEHQNEFPWLDIALEWSGDQPYFHKRQHVGDDLVNLADAIAAACETERRILIRERRGVPPIEDSERLFSKRVVCVHPAAGNEMRQWPAEHFVALIDQLASAEDVHIALIGGPDEAALASVILDKLRCSDAVWSLIGKVRLGELPDVLTACSLFVGNNSGPHHIAAALGLPTIGIHSGVTDTGEWGPMGPQAIAISRDMSCGPCYLSKMEECSRNFACMRQLLPGEVYHACKRLLALAPPPGSGRG